MKELTSLERMLLTRSDAVWLLREASAIQVVGGFILHNPLAGLIFVDDLNEPGTPINFKVALKHIKTTYSTR